MCRFLAIAISFVSMLSWAGAARAACTIPTRLGVAFSIDDSGSMADSDPDLLRSAATGAGIDQLPDGAFTAVSSFDSASRALVDPVEVTAANRPTIKADVDSSLHADGDTYYDLAFSEAKQQLDAMPGADKRALVFLSDGAPTDDDHDDELAAIRNASIPVFTIGFGSAPGSVLAEIAASTGGQAYIVQSPGEAQAVFARIVSTLTCDAQQVRANVTLSPGESRAFPFTIGLSDREFRALATWENAGVSARVLRPDGSVLTPGAEHAGERFISEETYASIIGTNPPAGGWVLQITAAADNIDQVDVSIDIFRRTSADPPDAFALVVPATGALLPRGPTTFQWVGARNAEGYELEVDDRVVVSGIARDASSVVYAPSGAPGPHSWRIAAVNQFGRTLSERRTFTMPDRAPVVLVGGLTEDNPQVLPSAPCRGLVDFRRFCDALTAAGHPVYVIQSTHGGRGREVLDDQGSVQPNAAELADFLHTFVPTTPSATRPSPLPLIVGHSMGGLIARTAISDFGVRAAGLLTIGTPHTGSYGADLAVAAIAAPCAIFDVVCKAVKAAVATVVTLKGSAAVQDLTSVSRRAANRSLAPMTIRTWAFAGTPCSYALISDPYWSPNDGIVGAASAYGHGSGMGPGVEEHHAALWHNVSSPLLCIAPGAGRPNEFTSDEIVRLVADAADAADHPTTTRVAGRPAGAGAHPMGVAGAATAAAGAARRVVRATLKLTAASGRRLDPGDRVPGGQDATLVAARDRFSLACGGGHAAAIPIFDSHVYAVDPRVARCPRATVVAPKALNVLIASDTPRVRAAVTITTDRVRLSIASRTPVRSAVLRAGKDPVRVRTQRAGGHLIFTAATPARGRGRLRIDAVVGSRSYGAYLPAR